MKTFYQVEIWQGSRCVTLHVLSTSDSGAKRQALSKLRRDHQMLKSKPADRIIVRPLAPKY